MTGQPDEQAAQILELFSNQITSDDYPSEAKACAEMYVKGKIEELTQLYDEGIAIPKSRIDYWHEVYKLL